MSWAQWHRWPAALDTHCASVDLFCNSVRPSTFQIVPPPLTVRLPLCGGAPPRSTLPTHTISPLHSTPRTLCPPTAVTAASTAFASACMLSCMHAAQHKATACALPCRAHFFSVKPLAGPTCSRETCPHLFALAAPASPRWVPLCATFFGPGTSGTAVDFMIINGCKRALRLWAIHLEASQA